MSHPRITTSIFAGCLCLLASSPARASGIDDLKNALAEGERLWSDAKDIATDYESLSASVKAKLQAKKERFENAAKAFVLVADALRNGRPLPVYLSKASGQSISCGDKVYLHNTGQDKVLRSEAASDGKPLYVAVNLGWNGKQTLSAANIRIECRDKADGISLAYGDTFTLRVDPDKDRPDGKNLDDGKPYFYAGTKAGYDPVVRLGDKAEIDKWGAYWSFRGGQGAVQTGIPMEMIATNRPANANIGGFCGVGPAGAYPVVRFGMHNHCGYAELAAGLVSEGVGKPPQWVKDLGKEVKTLAEELRTEIRNARSSGASAPTASSGATKMKPSGLFK